MSKVRVYNLKSDSRERGRVVWIFCPGCKRNHVFQLDVPQDNGAMWTWNGDEEKPTFNPSMLVFQNDPDLRCHSFVTDGNIQFLGDCFHELKNKTVELPNIDEDGEPINTIA